MGSDPTKSKGCFMYNFAINLVVYLASVHIGDRVCVVCIIKTLIQRTVYHVTTSVPQDPHPPPHTHTHTDAFSDSPEGCRAGQALYLWSCNRTKGTRRLMYRRADSVYTATELARAHTHTHTHRHPHIHRQNIVQGMLL